MVFLKINLSRIIRIHGKVVTFPFCRKFENEPSRHKMLFYFNKRNNAAQARREICGVYGVNDVRERVMSKMVREIL